MLTQQKETDLEQDKKMGEIEDQIKSVQSALNKTSQSEETSQKLAEMQTEIATMQETFQEKMALLESRESSGNQQTQAQPSDSVPTVQGLNDSSEVRIKAQIKTLEERTKQGFMKVKTDF